MDPKILDLEIDLLDEQNFLKIKETLTRMGVVSHRDKTLYQSAHILHKKGRYYIVHFKELFALDGKPFDLSEEDYERRNNIALLLQDWNLGKILNKEISEKELKTNNLKIISFKEKHEWKLQPKYNMGGSKE